jgi:hypothetical protein
MQAHTRIAAEALNLTEAQVFHGLSYFFDHMGEISALIARAGSCRIQPRLKDCSFGFTSTGTSRSSWPSICAVRYGVLLARMLRLLNHMTAEEMRSNLVNLEQFK